MLRRAGHEAARRCDAALLRPVVEPHRVDAAESARLVDDVTFLGVDGVSENLSASVSAAAASALVAGERPVRLPETLGALRQEYDWIAGAANADGQSWQGAGSQFCRIALTGNLRVQDGRAVVSWNVRDTITGQIVSSEEQVLEADPTCGGTRWEDAASPALPHGDRDHEAPGAAEPETETLAKLRDNLRKARGLEANVALLKLARANPTDPMLLERGFEKGGSKREGWTRF